MERGKYEVDCQSQLTTWCVCVCVTVGLLLVVKLKYIKLIEGMIASPCLFHCLYLSFVVCCLDKLVGRRGVKESI